MPTAADLGPPAAGARPSFRDVPWGFRDVLVGLAVLFGWLYAPSLLPRAAQGSLPAWFWIPHGLVGMAWMAGYPLAIAARKVGLPPLPEGRSILIEALLAIAATPVVLVVLTLATALLQQLLGDAALPTNPLRPIAASPDRFQSLALIVLAMGVAPFAEEIFFRGMLDNALGRRVPSALALILQALAFALGHPFGASDRAAIATIGLMLGLYYRWRKALLAPILLHLAVNAVMMTMMFQQVAIAARAPVLGVRGTTREAGLRIDAVLPGTAAAAAGLRPGDLIQAIDDHPVTTIRAITDLLQPRKSGDRIAIHFRRGDQPRQVEATLEPRPQP